MGDLSSSFFSPNPTLSSFIIFINLKKKKGIETKQAHVLGFLAFLFFPSTFLCVPVKGDASCHWANIYRRTLVPTTGSRGLVQSLYNIPQCPKLEASTCSLL